MSKKSRRANPAGRDERRAAIKKKQGACPRAWFHRPNAYCSTCGK